MSIDPAIETVFPIEPDRYMAFEWRDESNLLQEPGFLPDGYRGQYTTSVDAAVYYRTQSGSRSLLLLECKYTEPKSIKDERTSDHETDKRLIYKNLFFQDASTFIKELAQPQNHQDIPSYESLFFGEGYQLMRLQLLAHEIQNRGRGYSIPVDDVRVVFVTPRFNCQVRLIPSSKKPKPCNALSKLGSSWEEVWPQLLRRPSRFISVFWEDIFSRVEVGKYPKWRSWADYSSQRYRVTLR